MSMPAVNLSSSGGILQLGGIYQPRTWFETLDANQLATMGMETEAMAASLGAETGNVTDSINYLGELNVYDEPLVEYKFPINFNDTWNSEIVSSTQTEITINSLGIDHAPAYQLMYSSYVNEVSGYGTLLLPNPNDTGVISMEVLLMKMEETRVDSIFYNGQPAPAAFLNALNLTQANVTSLVSYQFISKDLNDAAFYLYYENDVNLEKNILLKKTFR